MITKEEATKEALAYMENMETGVLATVSSAGQPYSSTVYFAFQEDFSIFFIVSHHSQKFKNLTINSAASFTIGSGPEYREVTIRGKVEIIDDPKTRDFILSSISERVASRMTEWPVFNVQSLREGGTALCKLSPDAVSYLDLESKLEGDTTKHIYQLFP